MDLTIIALGSRGDVLPYAALGRALREAGHRVCFATFASFEPLVAARGLGFHPVRGDAQAIMLGSGGQALAESGRSVVRMAVGVMRSFGALARDYARDLSALASQPADLVVNQLPGGLYGYDLAERLGVPMVAAAVMPLVPTRSQPMLAFPRWPSALPGYCLLTHRLAYQLVWQAFRPTVNRWRQEVLGLKKMPLCGIFRETRESIPVLNGFSAQVVPRPSDWGQQVHVTGAWFPEDADWRAPDDLLRFLDDGPPPVFAGFGSMPLRDAERVTDLVLEALRQSGQRAIVHAGWGGVGGRALPEWAFGLDYAPYGWLFPRMAALIHHGGSGTTAFGLRSGVPAVVVPFLFDQFYWGQRIVELGVGPAPVPFGKLSAGRLADAIRAATTDGGMRERARRLGTEIQAEDGLGAAVQVLEGLVPG
jgi:UDP:flavonoid glycosyltransferase YjiC (YdhE family)